MRIAQIAPLWESVPPVRYGGTELVVHLITEELVRRGHDVTLFATGDSKTDAKLVPCAPKALREYLDESKQIPTSNEVLIYDMQMLSQIFKNADQFDVIHNHTPFQGLPFANLCNTPVLTTLHGIFDPPALKEIFLQHKHLPYVSISDFQRIGCTDLNYVDTIYHGLNLSYYQADLNPKNKPYLAFLGRFSPEKGAHLALRAARESGWPMILAGKVNWWEESYYQTEVKPYLDGKNYRMIGEVNLSEKVDLLKNAAATLCPILWAEPFGLVITESMACGTPVIAMRNGSVPELIEDGVSGYIVNSYNELVSAIGKIDQLDRQQVYQHVSTRFTVEHMTDQYLSLYQSLLHKQQAQQIASHFDTSNIRRLPDSKLVFPSKTGADFSQIATVNLKQHSL